MSDFNELKRLALAATPQNFDSAEEKAENGYIECPHCGGSGEVELEADYCNYDNAAIGVQFYGIGHEFGAAEAYYRAANPRAISELVDDFDRVTAERDAALEEVEALKHWRDLALQFDNHRMSALWHLKTLVSDGAHYDAAAAFLAEPPIPQSELQQRLTAADERVDVLEGLVGEVLDAIGREPLDLDAVLRLRARMRAALKPAEAPRNQCDGCQAGIPLINGTHRMGREGGYPDFMGCSAKLYKPAEGGDDE